MNEFVRSLVTILKGQALSFDLLAMGRNASHIGNCGDLKNNLGNTTVKLTTRHEADKAGANLSKFVRY